MIRKLLMVGSGVVLVTVVLVGRDAYSYLRTSAGYVTDAVQEAVPIEFQIDRARGMIDDLVPEVRKNMHVIAKEEVAVQQLDRQIAESQSRLARDKKQLLQRKADAASGKKSFEYVGRRYTLDEVRADLAVRFERYKTAEATAASWREVRDARQKSLAAAQRKLDAMLASKRQLQVEVENLEARLQTISAARAGSECQFDESRLGRVKQLVAGLRTRLDVAERLTGAEISCRAEIPLDQGVPEDIVQQISEHFANK
ncbi:MAG: hypothetical protein LLF97_11170 [Planctomycetaceae bacterium]|nr:hypothetical protein [Planctomycetaceae bacterium]